MSKRKLFAETPPKVPTSITEKLKAPFVVAGTLFLCGLPDVPESRPHSKSFDPLKELAANFR